MALEDCRLLYGVLVVRSNSRSIPYSRIRLLMVRHLALSLAAHLQYAGLSLDKT